MTLHKNSDFTLLMELDRSKNSDLEKKIKPSNVIVMIKGIANLPYTYINFRLFVQPHPYIR